MRISLELEKSKDDELTSSLAEIQIQVHLGELLGHPSLRSEAFSKCLSEVFRGCAFLASDLFEVAAMTWAGDPCRASDGARKSKYFRTREL